MVKVQSAHLNGPIEIDRVTFVRFEWWPESPRFVLLRYQEYGEEAPEGMRLDLDKKAILDDLPDDELDAKIRSRAPDIWDAVMATKFFH